MEQNIISKKGEYMFLDMSGGKEDLAAEETLDKEADSEREKTARLVFEMVQDSHGTPREGKDEESWVLSQRVSRRIESALDAEKIKVPYEFLTQIREFFAEIRQKTKFSVILSPDSLDIMADVLTQNYDQLNYAEHDSHPYLEQMMRKAFGKKFDSRVLEVMRGAGITEADQIAEAFADLQQYYEVYRRVLNSKESFDLAEGTEENPIECLSPELMKEVLENFSSEELINQPINAGDVLRIIGEFELGFPVSWQKCSLLEQNIVRKIMKEAVGGKSGAILIDSPEGPIITAKKDEN